MNDLQIIFQQRIKQRIVITEPIAPVQQDKRYRILVNLVRSDRPRYWNFKCFNCSSKIVELMNLEVLDATDFYDSQNLNNSGIGRHCKGTLDDGLPCPYSYFFNVH